MNGGFDILSPTTSAWGVLLLDDLTYTHDDRHRVLGVVHVFHDIDPLLLLVVSCCGFVDNLRFKKESPAYLLDVSCSALLDKAEDLLVTLHRELPLQVYSVVWCVGLMSGEGNYCAECGPYC